MTTTVRATGWTSMEGFDTRGVESRSWTGLTRNQYNERMSERRDTGGTGSGGAPSSEACCLPDTGNGGGREGEAQGGIPIQSAAGVFLLSGYKGRPGCGARPIRLYAGDIRHLAALASTDAPRHSGDGHQGPPRSVSEQRRRRSVLLCTSGSRGSTPGAVRLFPVSACLAARRLRRRHFYAWKTRVSLAATVPCFPS